MWKPVLKFYFLMRSALFEIFYRNSFPQVKKKKLTAFGEKKKEISQRLYYFMYGKTTSSLNAD